MRWRRIRQLAFTLVELMLVVVVLAALALIAIPAFQRSIDRARTAQAVRDIGELSMAVERFHTIRGSYPASLGELGPNLPSIDPWGHAYHYLAIDTTPRPPTGSVR